MSLTDSLLRVAFHEDVREANFDLGLQTLTLLIGGDVGQEKLANALAAAVANGLIHDPVRLLDGGLQCQWHLRLTQAGVAVAQGLIA